MRSEERWRGNQNGRVKNRVNRLADDVHRGLDFFGTRDRYASPRPAFTSNLRRNCRQYSLDADSDFGTINCVNRVRQEYILPYMNTLLYKSCHIHTRRPFTRGPSVIDVPPRDDALVEDSVTRARHRVDFESVRLELPSVVRFGSSHILRSDSSSSTNNTSTVIFW